MALDPILRDELTAILIEELAVSQADALLERVKHGEIVSGEEAELVNLFRQCSPEHRQQIRRTMEAML